METVNIQISTKSEEIKFVVQILKHNFDEFIEYMSKYEEEYQKNNTEIYEYLDDGRVPYERMTIDYIVEI